LTLKLKNAVPRSVSPDELRTQVYIYIPRYTFSCTGIDSYPGANIRIVINFSFPNKMFIYPETKFHTLIQLS
jgi:hypothetical protein